MTAVRTNPDRRRLRSAGDVALTVAAILGALVALFAVLAAVFHLSIILFKTGSMSPTIPAGSAALVREMPAAEARTGDVVTVDRPGELPVTHRVVTVKDLGGGRAELVLKGDANLVADPTPYTVSTVRLTLASLPGIAPLFVVAANPLVLGGVTLGAAALVGWAFWPRSQDAERRPRRRSGPRHSGTAALAVVVALAGATAVVGAPDPAAAETTRTVYTGTYLTLVSVEDPAVFLDLQPGKTIGWTVGVSAHPPEPGTVHLGISGTGPLTVGDRLTVSIRSCAVEWADGACASGERTVVRTQGLGALLAGAASDGVVELGTMRSADRRWLDIAVTLAGSGTFGGTADLRVHAWGTDDAVVTGGPGGGGGSLAATGADPLSALPLTLLAVVGGIAVAAFASRRRTGEGR